MGYTTGTTSVVKLHTYTTRRLSNDFLRRRTLLSCQGEFHQDARFAWIRYVGGWRRLPEYSVESYQVWCWIMLVELGGDRSWSIFPLYNSEQSVKGRHDQLLVGLIIMLHSTFNITHLFCRLGERQTVQHTNEWSRPEISFSSPPPSLLHFIGLEVYTCCPGDHGFMPMYICHKINVVLRHHWGIRTVHRITTWPISLYI